MGRAKLKMEYIMKEKSRNLTFKKRKEGLIKKIKEFTTLCDVSACMIVYGPEDCSMEPLVWPENNEEIKQIINIYRSKNKNCENNDVGLADFLKDRSKKIEEELSKLQEINIEANYFTSIEFLNDVSENQLREFSNELNIKLDGIYSMIEMMKVNSNGGLLQPYGIGLELMNYHQPPPISSINPLEMQQMLIDPEVYNVNYGYVNCQTFEQKAMEARIPWPESQHTLANPNSMMMLLRNDNDNMQFGAQSNNDVHCGPYMQQGYYEASQGIDNVLYDDSVTYLKRYFNPTQQPMLSPYMQCTGPMPTVMPSGPPPLNTLQVNQGVDIDHYQIKDPTAKY